MRFRLYLVLGIILLSIGSIIAIEVSSPSEVRINLFKIIYSNFDGSTTNFDSLNYSQVINMSGVIIEKNLYGRIEFLENLNLFDMKDVNWTVDFNKNLNITSNLINVDDYLLPGINKSAMLYFYGITFTTPIIYNKGVVCSNCIENDYLNGIYSFNTSLFEGPYYLKEGTVPPVCGDLICESPETSLTCPIDCPSSSSGGSGGSSGGGGGGGGGASSGTGTTSNTTDLAGSRQYNFTIYPTLIEASVRKGSYFQKKITVENTGSTELIIAIVVDGVTNYVFPEFRSFSIMPGEIKEIRFDIYVSDGVLADAYLGKIRFISEYVSRTSDFVLLVRNKNALFDIRTMILKKYVNPGGRARANITVINMGDLRNFDVDLEYKILDFDHNEYTTKKEQFAINTTHDGIYFLDTPKDLLIGNYIFYSTIRYGDVNATSYDTFTIENISYISWIFLIIIIFILIYITIRWYKKRKKDFLEQQRLSLLNPIKKEEKANKIPIETDVPFLP